MKFMGGNVARRIKGGSVRDNSLHKPEDPGSLEREWAGFCGDHVQSSFHFECYNDIYSPLPIP